MNFILTRICIVFLIHSVCLAAISESAPTLKPLTPGDSSLGDKVAIESEWNFLIFSNQDRLAVEKICGDLSAATQWVRKFECYSPLGGLGTTTPSQRLSPSEKPMQKASAGAISSGSKLLSALPHPHAMVVAIEFLFTPSDGKHLASFLHWFESRAQITGVTSPFDLVGPHFTAQMTNRFLNADLPRVFLVASISFIGLFVFFAFAGFRPMLFLLPIIGLAMGLSALFTYLFYGYIHSVTLAFGSAIVGLGLDYGIHALSYREKIHVWRANKVGFLTTLIVLVVGCFSGVPTIGQMMFFSIIGLSLAYVMSYLLTTRFFTHDILANFHIQLRSYTPSPFIFLAVLVASFYSLQYLRANLQISPLDFRTQQIQQDTRLENLAQMNQKVCQEDPYVEKAEKNRVATFLKEISCDQIKVLGGNKYYNWLGSFFFGNGELDFKYPGGKSYIGSLSRDINLTGIYDQNILAFPNPLQKNLVWLWPLSILLIFMVLLWHYRNIYLSVGAFIPFLSGMSLVALVAMYYQWPISSVSLLAFILLAGLSIDYGVFITNGYSFKRIDEMLGTSIPLCALTSLVGIVPLFFSQNPLLPQLGLVMVLGLFGALMGSFFALPWWLQRYQA